MIERRLVQQARAGEPAALQAVLEGLQGQAWAIARDFIRDWDEAADLAQEILVEVSRSLPALRDPERLEGWCAILGQRVCLAWKQREQRRRLVLGALQIEEECEDPSIASRPFGTPEERLLADEQRRGLREALQKLSRQSRQILELFYLDGRSLREIAAQLGVSENTVKQRLHWGRGSLRVDSDPIAVGPADPTPDRQRTQGSGANGPCRGCRADLRTRLPVLPGES